VPEHRVRPGPCLERLASPSGSVADTAATASSRCATRLAPTIGATTPSHSSHAQATRAFDAPRACATRASAPTTSKSASW
jgi:hypothetical protein